MSSFILKIIALATMIIDHTGAMLASEYATFTLRCIGRIAFPIYAFLIAEGCRHTANIKKYFFRLALFALISEPAFDLLFENLGKSSELVFFNLRHQNVFFTLSIGVVAIYLMQLCKEKGAAWLGIIPAALMPALAYLLHSDYGYRGVLLIIGCYLFKNKYLQLLVITVFISIQYFYSSTLALYAGISIIFIYLYNGRQGFNKGKWLFYAIYPAHLLLLAGIYLLFIR